ncbi:conjugal transfer protein [Streptomyces aureus]
MKRRSRKERTRHEVVDVAGQELDEQSGWWTSPSTGSVAVATNLVRRLAWALLISGPLLGGWAIVSQSAAGAHSAPVVQSSSGGDMTGPGGFAEMYVAAFLRAGEGSQGELAAFYPRAEDLELGGKPDAVQVGQIAAVRVKEVAPGRFWSVTVAVRVLEPAAKNTANSTASERPLIRMRFFRVPVEADRGGGPLAALALPAEISAPTGGAPKAELAYGAPLPAQASDPAVATLTEFFAAYLSGSGELGRYISPGTRLSSVRPAPYRSATVTQVAVENTFQDSDGDGRIGAPAGRERLRLVVDVHAARPDGIARPLSYALTLAGRDGRWEVAALDDTPQITLPDLSRHFDGSPVQLPAQ